MRIRSLSTLECSKVLEANRFAHLACARDGRPYVVPVYFAYADNHLYSFSMLGKKIDCMRTNPHVSVVVEERGEGRQWKSVIVDGRYEELPDRIGHKRERDHAWSLLSKHVDWWEPGALKPVNPPLSDHSDHVFFRILVDEISGREAREDGGF
jgi:nitroimidazol reductase NimA-like FMN-containing flavoprotein (pyridoxamine 5'-phosphate oxidase superfamily)